VRTELEERIREKIRSLRALEESAAANPGIEASHDHDETPEFEAYGRAYGSLARWLGELPAPGGWLAWYRAARQLGHEMGDATMPGVHKSPMGWDPEALSLLTPLLEAIFRAVHGGEDGATLLTPDVKRLLADRFWWESAFARRRGTAPGGVRNTPGWTDVRADIAQAAALSPDGVWEEDDPIRHELAWRADPGGLFRVTSYAVDPAATHPVSVTYTTRPLGERAAWIALHLQDPGTGTDLDGGTLNLHLPPSAVVPHMLPGDLDYLRSAGHRIDLEDGRLRWAPPAKVLEGCPRPDLSVSFPFWSPSFLPMPERGYRVTPEGPGV